MPQSRGKDKIKKAQTDDLVGGYDKGKIKKSRQMNLRPRPPGEDAFFEVKMRYILLSDEFFRSYSACSELLYKPGRPYLALVLELNGQLFAIPFRSHIKHENAFMTNTSGGGLDYTKTVVISDPSYISSVSPNIRPDEHKALQGKEHDIKVGLRRYIKLYKKARAALHVPRNRMICQYSSLQYFEDFI